MFSGIPSLVARLWVFRVRPSQPQSRPRKLKVKGSPKRDIFLFFFRHGFHPKFRF